MAFVAGTHYEVQPNGCWLWLGYSWKGAPIGDGRRAHRVSYEAHIGPIPEKAVLHHQCGESLCINPEHLEPVAPRTRVRPALSNLTESDVATIIERSRAGERDEVIAADFGQHRTNIGRIVRGERWSDVGRTSDPEPRYCLECDVLLTNRRDARFCCQKHMLVYNNRKRKGMNKRITYPVVDHVWMEPATDPTRFGYKGDAGHPEGGIVALESPVESPTAVEDTANPPADAPGAVVQSPEVEYAIARVAEAAGKAPRRGRRHLSAAERKAIELRGMDLAKAHYEKLGWTLEDVSAVASYDFRATRPGAPEKTIEVKATTSAGAQVVLTRNEVFNARDRYPDAALVVVHGVSLTTRDGQPHASGGAVAIYDPWVIDDADLEAIAYSYSVPSLGVDARSAAALTTAT